MFCWKCGSQIEEEGRFCSQCGASLEGMIPDAPAEPVEAAPLPMDHPGEEAAPQKKKRKRWLRLGLAAAAVIAVAAVAWVLFAPKPPVILIGDESFKIGQVFTQDELEEIYRNSMEKLWDDYDGDIPSDLFASETVQFFVGSEYPVSLVWFLQTDDGDWKVYNITLQGEDSSFAGIHIGDSVADILEKYPEAFVSMSGSLEGGARSCYIYMDQSGRVYNGFDYQNALLDIYRNTEDYERRTEKMREYFTVHFIMNENGEVIRITTNHGW